MAESTHSSARGSRSACQALRRGECSLALAGGHAVDSGADLQRLQRAWWGRALRLLLLTLAVTPLRRLLHQPQLVQLRRPLGLWAFAYATTHFAIWLLDLQGFWSQMLADIAKRPFVTVGFLAWLLLVPLAATSTRGMMRRLGRRWGQLHRLVYAIGALGVLHFIWGVKSGEKIARIEPVVYAVILTVLLLARSFRSAKPPPQRGLERNG